jgi:hypothetical protein
MPLETELDRAMIVFVGKLTRITKDHERGFVTTGRATFEVSEWLKGDERKDMTALAVMAVGSGYSGAAVLPSYCAGQEGIWVVRASEELSWPSGLIDGKKLQEVKKSLAELRRRKWSEPVDGMQLSALYGSYYGTGIFVAVKNSSANPMFIPRVAKTLVTAVARDEAGKEYAFGRGGYNTNVPGPMPADLVRPGEVQYLDMYVFPKDLPYGKCSVAATLSSTIPEGLTPAFELKDRRTVKLWTGKAVTPAITVDYSKPADPRNGR